MLQLTSQQWQSIEESRRKAQREYDEQYRLMEIARSEGKVFTLTGFSSPTYFAETKYYIAGDRAVVHFYAVDSMGAGCDANDFRTMSIEQARKHYAQNKVMCR